MKLCGFVRFFSASCFGMKAGNLMLLGALVVGVVTLVGSYPVDTSAAAVNYLIYYGYLNHIPGTDGSVNTEDGMREAICDFQFMANLTMTCEFDAPTLAKMNQKRCGMPDVTGHNLDARRRKRYALGGRWTRTALTFQIDSITSDIANPNDVTEVLISALKVWSEVTPLTFTQVYGRGDADIVITFNAGEHGDGNPFDGASNVLAHAFYPQNGDAHFDEDEDWSLTGNGTNLFQVAAHEFGHSLGLGHSNFDAALMAPFYAGYVPRFRLHSDDIAGIRALYGANVGGDDVTMAQITESPSLTCTGRVDAVTTTRDRSTYIFEGDYVWKFTNGSSVFSSGFPKIIASAFPGLPANIDAAFYYPPFGKTYIFKGNRHWRYDNQVLDSGYPAPISDTFPGIPDDVDAAFVWSGNGQIYFIKGAQYYRYIGRTNTIYPHPVGAFRLPTTAQIVAVAQWTNSRTYFFTQDGDYYRYDDVSFTADAGYPMDTAIAWQGCRSTIESYTNSPDAEDGPNGRGKNRVGRLVPGVFAVVTSVLGALNL